MRSVVTGGAGFIGSHVVEALLAQGDEVLVLDDLSSGRERNLASAEAATLARADVRDGESLARRLEDFQVERVFHLAAQVDVRRAVADPTFDAEVNVLGTVAVLEAARRAGGVPVVFASTGGVMYGEGEGRQLPFAEDVPAAPETAYGVSKLAGESYVALYRRLYGMPGIALRLGNVYGPRQDPHGEAGVVAIFCGRLLDGEQPTIFGDGLQTRDYVYVGDAVRALVAASSALAEAGADLEGPLNVGTGRGTSVLDLLEVLSGLAETEAEPVMAPPRKGEIQHVAIDPARAGERLGWAAEVELAGGLERTWKAMRGARVELGALGGQPPTRAPRE